MSKKRESAATEPLSRIYLGPNLTNGRLAHATVFRGSIPVHLNDIREQRPEIDTLIVPISDFSTALARSKRPGTPENQAYEALKSLGGKDGE
jgi:hypothetical protein